MRVALIQMAVTEDKAENLATARRQLEAAKAGGADLAVLPEIFCCPYRNRFFRSCAEESGGPAQTMLSQAARELSLYVVGGSIPEREGNKRYNASFVYGRQGEFLARHRKLHLFDIDVEGGQRYRESDTFTPGDQITSFDTEFGPMGLCICFDLRFEELARCMTLRGVKALFVPAAFNMTTGPAHWELLFRQRAVDNQLFTVGVSPARNPEARYVAYGNSIAVDPWGSVLCRAGAEEALLFADLDFARMETVRRQLPLLKARRTDLYEIKEVNP